MRYVHVLVEGQTEETFIREVIKPCFLAYEIFLTSKIIRTKKVKNGPDFKGGITNYQKVKYEIQRLLSDSYVTAVTTMFDYYGLPRNFPGMDDIPNVDCYGKVCFLEKKFANDICNPKFLPFLSLHEFEAYLFTSPKHIAGAFPDENIQSDLDTIKRSFGSPEEINDGNFTHPSARLKSLLPSYRKVLHGSIIAKRIGIDLMRSECLHLNSWIDQICEYCH